MAHFIDIGGGELINLDKVTNIQIRDEYDKYIVKFWFSTHIENDYLYKSFKSRDEAEDFLDKILLESKRR